MAFNDQHSFSLDDIDTPIAEQINAKAILADARAKHSGNIKYHCARKIASIQDTQERALCISNMRLIHGNAVMDAIELSARAEYRLMQWLRSVNK